MKRKTVLGTTFTVLLLSIITAVFSIQSVGAPDAFSVIASINVGGLITSNTTWTEAESPYIVTSSVLVSQGVTLTIEPGVVVKFELTKGMQVDGQLIARGTEVKPIVFTSIRDDAHGGDSNGDGGLTSPAPGDWVYIFFTDPSVDATFDAFGNYVSGSILEYCKIIYGGGSGTEGAIRIDFSAPFLNHTIVSNSANSGIYVSQGTPKIAHSNISHNTFRGIDHSGGDKVTLVGNTVTNNLQGGISASVSSGTSIISNNTVTNNGETGISVSHVGAGFFTSTIAGNLICSNSGGGIHVYGGNTIITNNIVTHNSAGMTMSGTVGGGVYMSGGYADQTITNNIIAYNTAPGGGALYLTSPSRIALTVSDNSIIANTATTDSIVRIHSDTDSLDTFKYNLLSQNRDSSAVSNSLKVSGLPIINYNNLFNNYHSYEIHNTNPAGPSHVDAKNNWWGASNEPEIQAKIYDWFDDASKGIVDYTPYSTSIRTDTPISPPTGLTVSAEATNFTLSWNPNPEPDLAGYKIYYDTDSGYPYRYSIDVGNVTNYTLTGLPSDVSYFTITAYDAEADGSNDLFEGHESWYAPEPIIGTVPVIWEETTYPVALSSNSTVSMFQFNQPQMQISFNVAGPSGTIGFCNVTIPKSLLSDSPWTITVDGQPPIDFIPTSNNTHNFLYFTYTHASTSHVVIQGTSVIPEFPSAMILPLFMVLTMLAVVFAKRTFPRKLKT